MTDCGREEEIDKRELGYEGSLDVETKALESHLNSSSVDSEKNLKKKENAKKKRDRIARMGTDSIPRLIMEFAIPSIAGMLVNGAYNLIDSIFLGQAMGELGLSTTTVAFPVMTLFIALSMLVGNGGNALCALRFGEGRKEEAQFTLGNTVALCFVVWAVVAIATRITPLMNGMLSISGATAENWELARQFIQILSLGFICQMVGLGVNNFIRTAGAPNRALLTMVIGAVACTTFNYLFVLQLGWGVAGSAWATVLGQLCSAVSVMWYFLFTKGVSLKLRLRYMRLEGKRALSILSLGLASFAIQMGMAVVNFVLNNLLHMYGAMASIGAEGALASIGVVSRVAMFAVLPLIGIAIAIQPLLGYNYGACFYNRVKKTFAWGIGVATAIGITSWIFIQLFPEVIVGFFGIVNPEMVAFTAFAMRVQLFILPIVGYQIVGSNYFQATGQPLRSIFLSLTRQIIFLIPLYCVLPLLLPVIVPTLNSLDALYFAVPFADLLSTLTTTIFVVIEIKKLNKREKEESEYRTRKEAEKQMRSLEQSAVKA